MSRLLIPAFLVATLVLVGAVTAQAALEGNAWVSLDSSGRVFNSTSGAYSYPSALSGSGEIVAFQSLAPLVPDVDTNGVEDVFLRDTVNKTTELISAGEGGALGNNRSYGPAVTEDGALVAFESLASNLAAGDNNDVSDVFLRDRANAATIRISAPAGGDSNGSSYRPSISADGAFVAFCSRATNLVPDDGNGVADAFLWERATGALTRIAASAAAPTASDGCLSTSISSDGGVVAFSSVLSGTAGVFAYDRASGETRSLTDGANGPSGTGGVSISGDGLLVLFDSVADNLISNDTNRSRDVFLRDRQAGTTTRVSVRSDGSQLPGDSGASGLAISRNGNFVVFGSTARSVVPGDSNGHEDIFRRDLTAGQTTIASVDTANHSANNSSYSPAVNNDGSVVAFASLAANLVFGDGNRQPDVFVRGVPFPDKAGDDTRPPDTGAPSEDETTTVVRSSDDGIPPAVLYGGIAAGVVVVLLGGSLLLGRRGRA